MTSIKLPTLDDIQQAHARIRGVIHETPVMTCGAINEMFGADLRFKCENFQKVGAFKFRGASNAVLSLSDEEAAKGVATHSSGNHAAAIALAARMRGIESFIVMPDNSPEVKKKAVAGYGAKITFCKPTLKARETTLQAVIDETGAAFVHPYDNFRVVCGQGTCALELVEQIGAFDMIIAPVGGGGLCGGTATAIKGLGLSSKVIGAEPEIADDARESFLTGRLIGSKNTPTIADGLRTSLSELTFAIITDKADDIVTAGEEAIISAMRLIWERMKIIVEPSAVVGLAAIMENKLDVTGKKVVIILSGGNVDLEKPPF